MTDLSKAQLKKIARLELLKEITQTTLKKENLILTSPVHSKTE